MKAILFTLCAVFAAAMSMARPIPEPAVFLQAGDTLYIEVIDSVSQHNVGRNHRFRNIKATVEEVLESIDFPIDYKVVRFGANRYPQGQPKLNLIITRWGDNGIGQIEARFSASLKRNFDQDKLGVFLERGQTAPFFASDVDRVYNDVLRKALLGLASQLDARILYDIDVEDSEEESAVEAPLAE